MSDSDQKLSHRKHRSQRNRLPHALFNCIQQFVYIFIDFVLILRKERIEKAVPLGIPKNSRLNGWCIIGCNRIKMNLTTEQQKFFAQIPLNEKRGSLITSPLLYPQFRR
jgi:hypothetical protein